MRGAAAWWWMRCAVADCGCAAADCACGARMRGAAPARRAGRPFPHGLPAATGGPRDHHHQQPLSVLPACGVATKPHPCALVAFAAVQATQPLRPAARGVGHCRIGGDQGVRAKPLAVWLSCLCGRYGSRNPARRPCAGRCGWAGAQTGWEEGSGAGCKVIAALLKRGWANGDGAA